MVTWRGWCCCKSKAPSYFSEERECKFVPHFLRHETEFIKNGRFGCVSSASVVISGSCFHFVYDAIGGADDKHAGIVGNYCRGNAWQRILPKPIEILLCGFDHLYKSTAVILKKRIRKVRVRTHYYFN